MLDIEDEKKYTYTKLVEGNDYIDGSTYEDDGEKYVSFRVGPNPIEPDMEFCIEDSAGRFIPFIWEDIGELLLVLDSLSVKFNKDDKENKEDDEEDL